MLMYEAGKISFRGGMPSVVLLSGKVEERVEITLAGKGTKSQGTRSTPLGLGDEARGYTFTWTVPLCERNRGQKPLVRVQVQKS